MTERSIDTVRIPLSRGIVAALVSALIGVAASCGGSAPSRQVPSQATGVIVRIENVGASVRSFTLDSDQGELQILVAPDVDYGFDLRHLHLHKTLRAPVRCMLQERDGKLYALSILDA